MRSFSAAVVAGTFVYVPYHLYARSGFAKYLDLRRHLMALHAENEALRAANQRMAREAASLRADPAAIERVAREELGWVSPGEFLVDLSGASR